MLARLLVRFFEHKGWNQMTLARREFDCHGHAVRQGQSEGDTDKMREKWIITVGVTLAVSTVIERHGCTNQTENAVSNRNYCMETQGTVGTLETILWEAVTQRP